MHRNHVLKHVKSIMCEELGCKKAFSTFSDLARHTKKVHGIPKSYRCAASGCTNRIKIWPLDKFKQHMNRMHKEHDFSELLKL